MRQDERAPRAGLPILLSMREAHPARLPLPRAPPPPLPLPKKGGEGELEEGLNDRGEGMRVRVCDRTSERREQGYCYAANHCHLMSKNSNNRLILCRNFFRVCFGTRVP